MIQIGIDSFAKKYDENQNKNRRDDERVVSELIERIEFADNVGINVFGVGEHHRKEFLDSAPHILLSAAASKTSKIILTSAVAVLSAYDPVRLFQNYATIDLISKGRVEIVAGRGSFTEAFPLFGLNFNDYDELYSEKLDLLLKINEKETISWKGKFRPELNSQSIYPRPYQKKLPIWLGAGGSPNSFVRAGMLGIPLMVAVIGGQTHRFRNLINLYYQAAEKVGHDRSKLKVGLHSLGFVAKTKEEAIEKYYPGYKTWFDEIGKERGWRPVTFEGFLSQIDEKGALVIGGPEEVAEKIKRHSESLGGLARFTFQIDNPGLTNKDLMDSYELIGKKVIPLVNKT